MSGVESQVFNKEKTQKWPSATALIVRPLITDSPITASLLRLRAPNSGLTASHSGAGTYLGQTSLNSSVEPSVDASLTLLDGEPDG